MFFYLFLAFLPENLGNHQRNGEVHAGRSKQIGKITSLKPCGQRYIYEAAALLTKKELATASFLQL